MSTSYFILSDPRMGWSIEVKQFLKALKEKWPFVQLIPIYNEQDPYVIEWTIHFSSGDYMRGLLDHELKSVTMKGNNICQVVDFSVWFQDLYPDLMGLILLDEQASFDIDLYGRTETEILQLIRDGYSFTRTLGIANEENQAAKDNIL